MVVVFGSINLDLVSRVSHFPGPGETLAGNSFAMYPGGKGANQALAAARAGASVRLYGAIGRDAFAEAAIALLSTGNVDLGGVARVDARTGCAMILVNATGENCIVVVPGANAEAGPRSVPDAVLTRDTVLVLQQEVPAAANEVLVGRAHQNGARILFNAAPAHPVPLDLLRRIDVLIVNESEAAALAAPLGWPATPTGFAAAATGVVSSLAVVVTLGADGALWIGAGETLRVAAPAVDVVDTTGAGDAFVGALAAALDERATPADALRRAAAAGSLACTGPGAQPALPDRAAIDALLPSVTIRRV